MARTEDPPLASLQTATPRLVHSIRKAVLRMVSLTENVTCLECPPLFFRSAQLVRLAKAAGEHPLLGGDAGTIRATRLREMGEFCVVRGLRSGRFYTTKQELFRAWP